MGPFFIVTVRNKEICRGEGGMVRLPVPINSQCSSLYGAMQQQAFYFISRKYVHDVQQVHSKIPTNGQRSRARDVACHFHGPGGGGLHPEPHLEGVLDAPFPTGADPGVRGRPTSNFLHSETVIAAGPAANNHDAGVAGTAHPPPPPTKLDSDLKLHSPTKKLELLSKQLYPYVIFDAESESEVTVDDNLQN
ncbi:hypothetical protein NQ318_008915 [Aromia moschata]|uniref:Uncharacterized protein n=1 Tax=Aromia moschata TaxID=1265417 RepID=A0AAV8ZAF8_9CUCU|nr:hypothetical protein NQ318_008915 [Aromia moschata]